MDKISSNGLPSDISIVLRLVVKWTSNLLFNFIRSASSPYLLTADDTRATLIILKLPFMEKKLYDKGILKTA